MSSATASPCTVLVVDDDQDVRDILEMALRSAGFDIELASNGEDALALVDAIRPDLVILDWTMPRMSGIDVCRVMRSHHAYRSLPILLYSARALPEDRALALDAGATDCLVKPMPLGALVDHIRRLLDRDCLPAADPVPA